MIKNLLIFAIGITMLFACTKSKVSTGVVNTMTINDNGVYTEVSQQQIYSAGVKCSVVRDSFHGNLSFSSICYGADSNFYPIRINATTGYTGPYTESGYYSVRNAGWYPYSNLGFVVEKFNGFRFYVIDTIYASIGITGNNVQGTFWMQVSDATTNHIITGSLNCPQAVVK